MASARAEFERAVRLPVRDQLVELFGYSLIDEIFVVIWVVIAWPVLIVQVRFDLFPHFVSNLLFQVWIDLVLIQAITRSAGRGFAAVCSVQRFRSALLLSVGDRPVVDGCQAADAHHQTKGTHSAMHAHL
jgi:hypothetical protein